MGLPLGVPLKRTGGGETWRNTGDWVGVEVGGEELTDEEVLPGGVITEE